MKTIENLVQAVRENNGYEILLVPYSEPRMKTHFGWIPLEEKKLEGHESKEILFSILTETQKETLQKEGVLIGSVSLPSGMNLNFQMYKNKMGYSGKLKEIEFIESSDNTFLLSQLLKDQALKRKGIFILSGPSWSGKSTLMSQFIDFLNVNTMSHISIIESSVEKIHQPQKSVISHFEVGYETIKESVWRSLDYSDVVCLDIPFTEQSVEKILGLSESGKQIFLCVSIDSLLNLENRIHQIFSGDRKEYILSRWSHQLSLFINQRLIPNTSQGFSLAQEIIILNDQLRTFIKNNEIADIYNCVKTSGDKVGMKSLNQSIFHLLSKNKIDLKNAFLYSPNPEELDQMIAAQGV